VPTAVATAVREAANGTVTHDRGME
jgi:hypothetical protein